MIKLEFHPYKNKAQAVEAIGIVQQALSRLATSEIGGSETLLELQHMQVLYGKLFTKYSRDNDCVTQLELKEKVMEHMPESSFSDDLKKKLCGESAVVKVPTVKKPAAVQVGPCHYCYRLCEHPVLNTAEDEYVPCKECDWCCPHELRDAAGKKDVFCDANDPMELQDSKYLRFVSQRGHFRAKEPKPVSAVNAVEPVRINSKKEPDVVKMVNLPVFAGPCLECGRTCHHGTIDPVTHCGAPCAACFAVCCKHETFDPFTGDKIIDRIKFPTHVDSLPMAPPATAAAPKPAEVPKGAVYHALKPVVMEFWNMRCNFSEDFNHADTGKYAPAWDAFFRFFADKMTVEKVTGSLFLFNVTLNRSEAALVECPSLAPTRKVYNVVGRPLDIDNRNDECEMETMKKAFREKYVKAPQTEDEVVDMFRLIFASEANVLEPYFFKSGTVVY